MRRAGITIALLLATAAVAGCTGSTDPSATSPTSSAVSGGPSDGSSSRGADPSTSGEAPLSTTQAQTALDDAIAAIDDEGSIGFTSQGENVIDGEVNKISGSGAWTKNPLAWTTTTTYDGPAGSAVYPFGDETIEVIYQESTPRGAYVRIGLADGQSGVERWYLWRSNSGAPPPDGVTKANISTPRDLRILNQITATAASTLGDTLTVNGTIPSSSALNALDLTQHLGGLGFATNLEDGTAGVLVTIGADGLPQTLEFAGPNISLPGVGLPDYVAEELAGARYLVEYGDADLDRRIRAPAQVVG